MGVKQNKQGKIACDICGKYHATLGGYGEGCEGWWVCLKCFGKVDRVAQAEDRWPNVKDFKKLRRNLEKKRA
jgi:hypothetical protein